MTVLKVLFVNYMDSVTTDDNLGVTFVNYVDVVTIDDSSGNNVLRKKNVYIEFVCY